MKKIKIKDRELQILIELAHGHTLAWCARRFGLSKGRVSQIAFHAFRRLNVVAALLRRRNTEICSHGMRISATEKPNLHISVGDKTPGWLVRAIKDIEGESA